MKIELGEKRRNIEKSNSEIARLKSELDLGSRKGKNINTLKKTNTELSGINKNLERGKKENEKTISNLKIEILKIKKEIEQKIVDNEIEKSVSTRNRQKNAEYQKDIMKLTEMIKKLKKKYKKQKYLLKEKIRDNKDLHSKVELFKRSKQKLENEMKNFHKDVKEQNTTIFNSKNKRIMELEEQIENIKQTKDVAVNIVESKFKNEIEDLKAEMDIQKEDLELEINENKRLRNKLKGLGISNEKLNKKENIVENNPEVEEKNLSSGEISEINEGTLQKFKKKFQDEKEKMIQKNEKFEETKNKEITLLAKENFILKRKMIEMVKVIKQAITQRDDEIKCYEIVMKKILFENNSLRKLFGMKNRKM